MKKLLSAIFAIAFVATMSAASADWTRTSFLTDTQTQAAGQFQAEVEFDYAVLEDAADYSAYDIVADVEYGIMDNWNVGVVFGWQSVSMDDIDFEESGATDLVLDTNYKLMSEADAIADVSVYGSVKFATADEDKGLGTGEIDYGFGAAVAKTLIPELIAVGNLDYTILGDPDGIDYDNVLGWGVELIYNGVIEALSLHATIFGATAAVDGADDPLYYGVGAYYYVNDMTRVGANIAFGANDDDFDWVLQVNAGVLV